MRKRTRAILSLAHLGLVTGYTTGDDTISPGIYTLAKKAFGRQKAPDIRGIRAGSRAKSSTLAQNRLVSGFKMLLELAVLWKRI